MSGGVPEGFVPLGIGGTVPYSIYPRDIPIAMFNQQRESAFCQVVDALLAASGADPVGVTGALLDRLTHHVSILTMNGDSYRLKQSAGRRRTAARAEQNRATGEIVDPDTGEATTT